MKISIGAVVVGGTSTDYKTGAWRDQRPIMHNELCKPCDICEMVCPDSAIQRGDKYYVIDYDYCKGCGICANECPRIAIAMVPEEK
jgi:pyruvate ferredoxin oxidoreductase delta subunit